MSLTLPWSDFSPDDSLEQLRTRIGDESASARSALRSHTPFRDSEWHLRVREYIDPSRDRGDILRATFFSGGKLLMPFHKYRESLTTLADDVSRGVVLPINEIASNAEGTRLHFEVDYRLHRLPTESEVLSHLRLCHELVRECFPAVSNVELEVATCAPKLKFTKDGQVRIATGLHIVVPSIVLYSDTLKLLNQVLDHRLSLQNPLFNGSVDTASITEKQSCLRPLYAHKLNNCPSCHFSRSDKKKDSSKSRFVASLAAQDRHVFDQRPDEGVEFSDEEFESTWTSPVDVALRTCEGDCVAGRVVDPSVYKPLCTINKDGQVLLSEGTVLENLLKFSILPMNIGPGILTQGFVAPKDIPHVLDLRPVGHVLFKTERKDIKTRLGQSQIRSVRAVDQPAVYQLLNEVIRGVKPQWGHTLVHAISLNHKKLLYIDLKGPGCRWCPLKQTEHSSNRVSMTLCMSTNELRVSCYNSECSDIIKAVRANRAATTEQVNIVKTDMSFHPLTSAQRATLAQLLQLRVSTIATPSIKLGRRTKEPSPVAHKKPCIDSGAKPPLWTQFTFEDFMSDFNK